MGRLQWHFDIDNYLNYFVVPPPWKHLPYPIARFFGYRREKVQPNGNLVSIFWAFIGIWCAISIIEQLSLHIPSFESHHPPLIVGSFGATAVLEFYCIDSPLAQPRNAIFGQILSALTGVIVAKLFLLSDDFERYRWAGGALACSSATAVMALTKTVHPPAGATALLAVVDPVMVNLGWFLIPVMFLGSGIMQAVALLINNIEGRFPIYFWTPVDVRETSIFARRLRKAQQLQQKQKQEQEQEQEHEDKEHKSKTGNDGQNGPQVGKKADEDEEEEFQGHEDVENQGPRESAPETQLVIRASGLIPPKGLHLSPEEVRILEQIRNRL